MSYFIRQHYSGNNKNSWNYTISLDLLSKYAGPVIKVVEINLQGFFFVIIIISSFKLCYSLLFWFLKGSLLVFIL